VLKARRCDVRRHRITAANPLLKGRRVALVGRGVSGSCAAYDLVQMVRTFVFYAETRHGSHACSVTPGDGIES